MEKARETIANGEKCDMKRRCHLIDSDTVRARHAVALRLFGIPRRINDTFNLVQFIWRACTCISTDFMLSPRCDGRLFVPPFRFSGLLVVSEAIIFVVIGIKSYDEKRHSFTTDTTNNADQNAAGQFHFFIKANLTAWINKRKMTMAFE